ncbi:MAG TPA: mechanosensitive ion channel [Promineifilum sp.]|nr:mechanosensitive ion channel [Promineifilum sp.]HNS39225.1 mechanosensitive ion channel [Promineifilum sp.]
MRVHINVPVDAEANPRDVQAALLEACQHPEVLTDPRPTALITAFEGETNQYDLEFWINNPIREPYISSDVRLRIWELFSERGIEMNAPTDILVLHPEG